MNRRDWFQLTGLALGSQFASAQDKEPLAPLNRFPRAVQEWSVAQVRDVEKRSLDVQAKLKTKDDALAYIRTVKEKIAKCFGPLPEKTPLNAKITGTLDRDTYTVEKIIFESRPGFLVTANLYLPKGAKEKRPGVVGSCGHSTNGKAEPAYQSFAQGLARMGYVVLIYDPIGQGERLQYGHLPAKIRPSVGVGEHLYAGNQQFLVGEFFGTWRAWDGILALDYLLSRPEVDPKHVGITGNSGGGTLTTWLCGLDDRWTMAAPGCFITTFRRNLENELPADTEQCPPHALALGLDHADFLAALAPKPVIVLAKEKDFFDARGAEEAFRRLQRIYGLLGAEENVKLHIGPTGHGYTIENREAMYQWFNKATGLSKEVAEPKIVVEKDQDLRCTPTGQVADLKSRSVFSFTKQLASGGRKPPDSLATTIQKALSVPTRDGSPEYRILRAAANRKYPKPHATTYVLETEAPAVAVVYRLSDEAHFARPPKSDAPAILYVSHHSADAELREEPLVAEVMKAEPKATVYACDVRGVGETRPDTCGGTNTFLTPYGNDFFYAIHGIMLDRPYPGQKTFDLLRTLDWLASYGHKEIHLVAKGWGTIPATFAAVLHENVKRVTLKDALKSYHEIATNETYNWPLSSFAPGVLSKFDLPDCHESLKKKGLAFL
ncbi:MAG: prolyl oligopeptidase family serine peptidase [Gemmataceae bacterium]